MENLEILKELKDLIEANSYPPVMDMKKSAEYLSVSYSTLAREARLGRVRAKDMGGKKLFKREWLDEWMEAE